ncbi:hypothetical protein DW886_17020 [Enterocloster aldenensis]|uniref:hypothetical protein n=1 Tax=Enterocloster aldenensis TaxID=358742 RepID=UPI000E548876|nr:hypothetical protein DW886_17020 [Enterocloster aldenensis]
MDKQVLLYEYEQILLGNKTGFAPYYFKYGDDTSQNYALYIIKFAVETYLGWDPWDFKNHYNQEISKQLKLEPLMKYIDYPPELDKTKDYYYLAALIYPEIINIDIKELVLRTYKDVLDGKLCKFPKEYLSGTKGMMRASICLQYMLSQNYTFSSIKAMYKFFSEPAGSRALKKFRLSNICNEIYEHPLDYLHESLPKGQQDEYWYHFFRFKVFYSAQLKQIKKQSKFKA